MSASASTGQTAALVLGRSVPKIEPAARERAAREGRSERQRRSEQLNRIR
jgi:hypothetical protein